MRFHPFTACPMTVEETRRIGCFFLGLLGGFLLGAVTASC